MTSILSNRALAFDTHSAKHKAANHEQGFDWVRLQVVTIVLLGLLIRMATLENVSELKFFGGIGFGFSLYHMLFPPQDTFLVMPCSELSSPHITSSQLPILFKGCIPNSSIEQPLASYATFPSSTQNLFPSCEVDAVRDFEFTALDGNVSGIQEKSPCSSRTLQSKLDYHEAHSLEHDEPYFDVHVRLLSPEEERLLEEDFKAKSIIPDDFEIAEFGRTNVLTHFFASGTTAVNYYHAHMERFLSFGIFEETKTWELINPAHLDKFDYLWTGNALLMTKERVDAPRTIVHQEAGDILFLPPWWGHKTQQRGEKKSFNFNLHFMTHRSLLGFSAHIIMNKIGISSWFYSVF